VISWNDVEGTPVSTANKDYLNFEMMNTIEIKKALYKQKPEAQFMYIRKESAYYQANLNEGKVFFQIPVSDMGDADFLPTMEAKLLGRWIQN
jgi:hypothetical protein